jgi:hypothetical protein
MAVQPERRRRSSPRIPWALIAVLGLLVLVFNPLHHLFPVIALLVLINLFVRSSGVGRWAR